MPIALAWLGWLLALLGLRVEVNSISEYRLVGVVEVDELVTQLVALLLVVLVRHVAIAWVEVSPDQEVRHVMLDSDLTAATTGTKTGIKTGAKPHKNHAQEKIFVRGQYGLE